MRAQLHECCVFQAETLQKKPQRLQHKSNQKTIRENCEIYAYRILAKILRAFVGVVLRGWKVL